MEKREFTVASEYRYNRAGPLRWIVSHILRYPWLPGATMLLAIAVSILTSTNSVLVGRAFDLVATPGTTPAMVLHAALVILAIGAGQGHRPTPAQPGRGDAGPVGGARRPR